MIDGKTMKYLKELDKSNYVISSLKSEESELWTQRLMACLDGGGKEGEWRGVK